MANYYDGLLKLCGFEDDQIARESTRIDKAFGRLGLGPADMVKAEEWVRQGHDVALTGVRKLLGVWLNELIDLVLARDEGKRVFYYGFPTIPGPGMAIKLAANDIYCGCPDSILCHTLGQIFNKLTPVIVAGEEKGLPAGHAMCGLQQIRAGALDMGIIPVPDMVGCSSYYCDMGSKADELLKERYGHPTVYVDGSMDSAWGEYPDYQPERVKFTGGQLNKLYEGVKDVLGAEITDDVWHRAMSNAAPYFAAQERLTKLILADPMPLSASDVELAVALGVSSTGRAFTDGPEALSILCDEVEKRIKRGVGVVEKGSPRVLTVVDSLSDPTIANMMRDVGLAVWATIFSVQPARGHAGTSKYTTLGEKRAEWMMRDALFHSSFGVIKRCEEAVRTLDMDGVLWGYLYNCRPASLLSHIAKKYVEENTGVPVLPLEVDIYDSRDYSAGSLRTRVETFADMLRARKAVVGRRG